LTSEKYSKICSNIHSTFWPYCCTLPVYCPSGSAAEGYGLSHVEDIQLTVTDCLNRTVMKFVFTHTHTNSVGGSLLYCSSLCQQCCGCDWHVL